MLENKGWAWWVLQGIAFFTDADSIGKGGFWNDWGSSDFEEKTG